MEMITANHRRSDRIGAVSAAGAIAILLASGGCAWKQERDNLRAEKQQLAEENLKLAETLQSLRTETAEANATLEDVAKGLEDIRARELKAIQSSIQVAQEGKNAGGRRDQLEAEIRTIRDAIHKNLQKLARLEKSNRESGVHMASLQKLADEMKRSLEEKAATVAELESRVGDLSKTVQVQATSLAEKEAALLDGEARIAQKTKELNTAYVAVASKNVLKEKGVVERQGAILGVGGRWIETGKFDPAVFREIDLTKETALTIPAPASKVRVVTEQPKESYAIVAAGPGSKESRLEVKDPAMFWKGDRYLVVMIPD
jgi:hypothetical protein